MDSRLKGSGSWRRRAEVLLISSMLLSGCAVMPEQPPLVVDFDPVDGELPLPESFRVRGLVLPSDPVVVQPSPGETAMLSSDIASADLHPGPLPLVFTAPQRWVELTLAPERELPAGTSAELRGYDQVQGGTLMARSTAVLDPTAPVTVRLRGIGGELRRVDLEYAADGVERVTALRASTAGVAPPSDVVPPAVEILTPSAGQTLTGGDGRSS